MQSDSDNDSSENGSLSGSESLESEDGDCDQGIPKVKGPKLPHKTHNGTVWSFEAIFRIQANIRTLSPEQLASLSAEYFQDRLIKSDAAKQFLGRHFLSYMFVVFQRSSVQHPAIQTDQIYQIPIRDYVECKKTSVDKLYGWMKEHVTGLRWTAIGSGLHLHPQYVISQIVDARYLTNRRFSKSLGRIFSRWS